MHEGVTVEPVCVVVNLCLSVCFVNLAKLESSGKRECQLRKSISLAEWGRGTFSLNEPCGKSQPTVGGASSRWLVCSDYELDCPGRLVRHTYEHV